MERIIVWIYPVRKKIEQDSQYIQIILTSKGLSKLITNRINIKMICGRFEF